MNRFEKCHGLGSQAVLAQRLLLYTAGSRVDQVTFGRGNIIGATTEKRFRYIRTKTDVLVDVPVRKELQEVLDLWKSPEFLFFTHNGGKPYAVGSFGNWFSDRCQEAELPHCNTHEIRKLGATTLAEAGASEWQIMAYLGQKTPDEARTYVKKAERNKARRWRYEQTKFV